MSGVSFETAAYAKIILHSVKYPISAVNGVLLADKSQIGAVAGVQTLNIVDAVPLFHHTYSINAMSDVAMNQIELVAQADNRVIAGYYAACENFKEYCVTKCVGQHIAQKIVEKFPAAVFIVVHKKKILEVNVPAIKVHKNIGGMWMFQDVKKDLLRNPSTLGIVASLIQDQAQKDIIDFENFFDNNRLDWTNQSIDHMIANMIHTY